MTNRRLLSGSFTPNEVNASMDQLDDLFEAGLASASQIDLWQPLSGRRYFALGHRPELCWINPGGSDDSADP